MKTIYNDFKDHQKFRLSTSLQKKRKEDYFKQSLDFQCKDKMLLK